MGVIGSAVAGWRELRVALGGSLAAARRLYRNDQVDEILDRRLALETHRVGQSEREAESEFRLGQPPIKVMPQKPASDRLGRGLGKEHPLPRDQQLIEAHPGIELG